MPKAGKDRRFLEPTHSSGIAMVWKPPKRIICSPKGEQVIFVESPEVTRMIEKMRQRALKEARAK
jgi:hypothetical protein